MENESGIICLYEILIQNEAVEKQEESSFSLIFIGKTRKICELNVVANKDQSILMVCSTTIKKKKTNKNKNFFKPTDKFKIFLQIILLEHRHSLKFESTSIFLSLFCMIFN